MPIAEPRSTRQLADLHAGTSNERRCHCLCSNTTFTFGVLSRTVALKLQLHRQITPPAAAHWQASAGRNGALPTSVQLWDVRYARWAMEPRRVQARRFAPEHRLFGASPQLQITAALTTAAALTTKAALNATAAAVLNVQLLLSAHHCSSVERCSSSARH
ncbi:hypothetical protein JKP88DRAFT_243317 [Tribonema minus]|uniref:Uncharacterized protein n=1 Tax=Tribonema minus TaxID=303371 RepID=A0A836CJM6_9STRA|nr:hypothetical protein JKP88DRAFT_243317 [Tribonema minus]